MLGIPIADVRVRDQARDMVRVTFRVRVTLRGRVTGRGRIRIRARVRVPFKS